MDQQKKNSEREPKSHAPMCASRVSGECTCGEFEAQEAAEFARKRKIVLVMEGGVIQSVSGIPVDVVLEIRDYDVESYDLDKLEKDEHGDDCHISQWESR